LAAPAAYSWPAPSGQPDGRPPRSCWAAPSRRIGLALGYAVGIAGELLADAAVVANNFTLFLGGLFLLGAARATSDQSRYAAADVSPVPLRSRAVRTIVFAGTIGACGGDVGL
jgi:hypothetical protein